MLLIGLITLRERIHLPNRVGGCQKRLKPILLATRLQCCKSFYTHSCIGPHRSTTIGLVYFAPLRRLRRCGLFLQTQQRGLCVYLSVTAVSPAETAEAEPNKMPFGLWARMGPRNHYQMGVQVQLWEGAILRRRLIVKQAYRYIATLCHQLQGFQCAVLHKSAVLNKFVQFQSVKCAVGKWTIHLQKTV